MRANLDMPRLRTKHATNLASAANIGTLGRSALADLTARSRHVRAVWRSLQPFYLVNQQRIERMLVEAFPSDANLQSRLLKGWRGRYAVSSRRTVTEL